MDSSILTLHLSITSISVTLSTAQKTEMATHITSLKTIVSSMEIQITSFQFAFFVLKEVMATSVQIQGGSLEATTETASSHLVMQMKTVSLNSQAVTSVTAVIKSVLATAVGTATKGNMKHLNNTIVMTLSLLILLFIANTNRSICKSSLKKKM